MANQKRDFPKEAEKEQVKPEEKKVDQKVESTREEKPVAGTVIVDMARQI